VKTGAVSKPRFNPLILLLFALLPISHLAQNSRHSDESPAAPGPDRDSNGLPDELELRLANEFAPIVMYDPDEPNLPARVDQFLAVARLWFFSEYCSPQQVQVEAAASGIPRKTVASCRAPGQMIDSYGTRSADKSSTFYLATLPPEGRRGSADPKNWISYVHSYPNDAGGVTLQYWRFYLFNTAYWLGLHLPAADHGGDWEAVHVVLGPGPGYQPLSIRMLGHRVIDSFPWSRVIREGNHPLILASKGGHSSEPATPRVLERRGSFIEHQSWRGGRARWPGREWQASGALLLLGQKTRPMPGMEWIQYSGLWGTREATGLLPTYRSGYWGPAFNETAMRKDGFFPAWCEGIAPPSGMRVREECFASKTTP
jgi:hypothetical protein